jgi:glycolate oxidase FAD binding subunit
VLDWSGGLVWAEMDELVNVRTLMNSGQALLFRGPSHVRASEDVFHPQAPDLVALQQRLKRSLDPKGLFNPRRMYKDF